mmetsp:Transcript_76409/g.183015  ORF Transcript_76409/g.183015 Transcript_76409/m.183015 type:complete len:306 (+) Transcript_76409:1110-2027(+)
MDIVIVPGFISAGPAVPAQGPGRQTIQEHLGRVVLRRHLHRVHPGRVRARDRQRQVVHLQQAGGDGGGEGDPPHAPLGAPRLDEAAGVEEPVPLQGGRDASLQVNGLLDAILMLVLDGLPVGLERQAQLPQQGALHPQLDGHQHHHPVRLIPIVMGVRSGVTRTLLMLQASMARTVSSVAVVIGMASCCASFSLRRRGNLIPKDQGFDLDLPHVALVPVGVAGDGLHRNLPHHVLLPQDHDGPKVWQRRRCANLQWVRLQRVVPRLQAGALDGAQVELRLGALRGGGHGRHDVDGGLDAACALCL